MPFSFCKHSRPHVAYAASKTSVSPLVLHRPRMCNRPANPLHHLACDAKSIIPRKNSTNSAHALNLIIIPPMLALRICLIVLVLSSISRADFRLLDDEHPLLADVPTTAPAKQPFDRDTWSFDL